MDKIITIRQETAKNSMTDQGLLCTCDCGKPKFPKTSNRHIKPISEDQTRLTKILGRRSGIIEKLKLKNKPLRIMEIGVMAGDFAKEMHDNLVIEKMVLIDPFNNNDYMSLNGEMRFTSNTNLQYIKNLFKENNTVEILPGFSSDILAKYFLGTSMPEKFDFIYIDSDHQFLNTYNEILYASQILKSDGIIGIDDYTLSLNDPIFVCEVMQAVTEFLETNRDWKVIYYSFNDAGLPNIYLSKYFEDEHPQ